MWALFEISKGYSGYIVPVGLMIFVIMIFLNPKRDEFSSFVYHSGTVGFDIGYVGKYKDDYPQFIELIKKQIKIINSERERFT